MVCPRPFSSFAVPWYTAGGPPARPRLPTPSATSIGVRPCLSLMSSLRAVAGQLCHHRVEPGLRGVVHRREPVVVRRVDSTPVRRAA